MHPIDSKIKYSYTCSIPALHKIYQDVDALFQSGMHSPIFIKFHTQLHFSYLIYDSTLSIDEKLGFQSNDASLFS